jgi:hypothetical protein
MRPCGNRILTFHPVIGQDDRLPFPYGQKTHPTFLSFPTRPIETDLKTGFYNLNFCKPIHPKVFPTQAPLTVDQLL